MKYTDFNKLMKDYDDIKKHVVSLIDSRNTHFDIDDYDFIALRRLFERLLYFPYFLYITLDFNDLVAIMENEKDRFEVQKIQKHYIDKLCQEIDSFISCGRSWGFKDYRCVDWERRLVDFMVSVKETFFE